MVDKVIVKHQAVKVVRVKTGFVQQVSDHGELSGLSDDDHSIYGLSAPSSGAVTYNAGGTTTVTFDNGRTEVFTATVAGGGTTWAFAGLPAGKAAAALLILTNGGSQTQTFPAGTTFVGGVAPSLTASGKDKLLLLWDGSELTIDALLDVK